MGYTKIVQFGDCTEIYDYEKDINNIRKRTLSQIQKKRAKARRKLVSRSTFSVRRARSNFFRLVHHNNSYADSISFLTITLQADYKYAQATRTVREFFSKLKEKLGTAPRYISVPELTKKGRYHFHILVYDLPPEIVKNERTTRNLQRLFKRGFIDIRIAEYHSPAIAGYMAKYMAKALTDPKYETRRAYNCSRNIKKIRSYGSNSLALYMDLVVGDNFTCANSTEYDTKYLGRCCYRLLKN